MKPHRFFIAYLVCVILLGGCITMQPRSARQHQSVPDAPNVAYQKAVRAVQAMGGQLLSQDPHQRAISSRLNKAVVVNVTLTPQGAGTLIAAQATAEGGYILAHDVPEDVQAFFAAYQQQ